MSNKKQSVIRIIILAVAFFVCFNGSSLISYAQDSSSSTTTSPSYEEYISREETLTKGKRNTEILLIAGSLGLVVLVGVGYLLKKAKEEKTTKSTSKKGVK